MFHRRSWETLTLDQNEYTFNWSTVSAGGVGADFILLYYLLSIIFLYPSQPEYKIADPICTFLFSVLVLGTTLPVTKDVFRTLMEGKHTFLSGDIISLCTVHVLQCRLCFCEGTPQNINFNSVRKLLLSVRGIVAVHSLHMWSLNMTHSLLSVHVVTGKGKVNTANVCCSQSVLSGCGMQQEVT